MASRLISIIGKQTFSVNIASGTTPIVVLGGRFFEIADAVSGVLLVRVASISGMPAGSSFGVLASSVLALPDDPSNTYGATNTFVQINVAAADTGFPRLYLAGFTSASNPPPSAQAAFSLGGNYGSAAGLATIVMAVDLLIRDA